MVKLEFPISVFIMAVWCTVCLNNGNGFMFITCFMNISKLSLKKNVIYLICKSQWLLFNKEM